MISYLKNAVKTWSHAQVFLITLGEDASVNEGNCAWFAPKPFGLE